jgi:hypothetical protein
LDALLDQPQAGLPEFRFTQVDSEPGCQFSRQHFAGAGQQRFKFRDKRSPSALLLGVETQAE